MTGISEMFAEFEGRAYDEYQLDLFAYLLRMQSASKTTAADVKRWRKFNPDKSAAQQRRRVEKYREHYRELWRKSSAAYRERKRAEMRAA